MKVLHSCTFVGTGVNVLTKNRMKGGKIVQLVSGLVMGAHHLEFIEDDRFDLGHIFRLNGQNISREDGKNDDMKLIVENGIDGFEFISPSGVEREIYNELTGPLKGNPARAKVREIDISETNFMKELEAI